MQKANTLEPTELTGRLERKLQRKAKSGADRRQARHIKHALSDFRGTQLSILYEEMPYIQ
jgi:hypothetical protein